jgi:UDP-2-acetamido-2-deoxy-ribo-hexuluronate aminotransferase
LGELYNKLEDNHVKTMIKFDIIQMVDLVNQHKKIQKELDKVILEISHGSDYINGEVVKFFSSELSEYMSNDVITIPCGNGTDALQIALMALELNTGDEVIVPSFSYAATAEVIILLGLNPVFVDVDSQSFNLDIDKIEESITNKTRVIIPVHLFGQGVDMERLKFIAKKYNLFIIEDNAQSLGSTFTYSNGEVKKLGTIGDIGCTSFFPTKNLGCMGDGGAIFTANIALAEKIKMIANHGQKIKYYHEVLGCNSRLDTIQAGILRKKLKHLDNYISQRKMAALYYDAALKSVTDVQVPIRASNTSHSYHQYTLKVSSQIRKELQSFLKNKGIPTMIYYPIPLHYQKAYMKYLKPNSNLNISEVLSKEVISLPMHTELTEEIQSYIVSQIITFFNKS